MQTSDQQLSLVNLAGGAAVEKFDIELARVIRNLLDPNTTVKPREITVKVKLAPANERRDQLAMRVEVTSKLGAHAPLDVGGFMGIQDGRPVAFELVQKQLPMFDQPKDGDVTDITDYRKEAD